MWTHCYCARVGSRTVLESGDGLVAEDQGDVGAERNLQVSSSPCEEPPAAPRREGTSSRTLGLLRAQRHLITE